MNNVKVNENKLKIGDVASNLMEAIGGKTTVNYVPVRDTILLKCVANIQASTVASCDTVGAVLMAADDMYRTTLKHHMHLEVAAISKDMLENNPIPLGTKVDIKTVNGMVYKSFIKDSVNILQFLKDFKSNNPILYTSVKPSQAQKISKTLPMNFFETTSKFKDDVLPTDLIELTFHVVTEFHNISGIYVPIEDID